MGGSGDEQESENPDLEGLAVTVIQLQVILEERGHSTTCLSVTTGLGSTTKLYNL